MNLEDLWAKLARSHSGKMEYTVNGVQCTRAYDGPEIVYTLKLHPRSLTFRWDSSTYLLRWDTPPTREEEIKLALIF